MSAQEAFRNWITQLAMIGGGVTAAICLATAIAVFAFHRGKTASRDDGYGKQ
ncbi:MAG TPA: hypothetical protein VHC19_22870 [Pirellulales bacterium]|jgi:hypothetical protein|nr:hypothetical protein [Pirellulales bacterium]